MNDKSTKHIQSIDQLIEVILMRIKADSKNEKLQQLYDGIMELRKQLEKEVTK